MQAQWTAQNSGTTENLNDVYCISADTVVVVGDNGTILRTINGGTDWLPVSNPATANLHKVQFAGTQTGYAAGDNGTLLKTTDSGASWQILNTNTSENLLSLSVLDANTIFAGGTGGLIIKSVDAGVNWLNLNTNLSQDIVDVQILSNNLVYAVPWHEIGTQNSVLLKTLDGGNTWSSIDLGYVIPVTGIHFENENTGYINNCDGVLGQVLYTNDGGNSVTTLFTSDIGTFNDFYVSNHNKIWIVGKDMRVGRRLVRAYISLFEADNTNGTYSASDFFGNSAENYAIDFVDNTGYVVGKNGSILKNPTGTMSLQKSNNKEFIVHPNPANDFVIIENLNDTKGISCQIIDVNGQVVLEKNLEKNIIDISQLPNGIYLLKLYNKNISLTQKLIIQK